MSASINGTSSYDPWTELSAKIKAVLTPEGKVQEASATSSIVVTDVPEAVALARKIVDDDNKLATTAINVKIEVINVTNDDDQNLGINWNLVFNEIENTNPLAAVTFSGPTLATSGTVGSFKVGIPSGSSSRFANSDYLIQALNKVGKAQTLLRRDFTTIHNVPSGFSRTNSKSYRAKTTAAPASSVGGSGQVGVEPGQVTTGTRFVVTPTYLGESDFAIEISYNDSFLRELVALGVGQQQIDAPDVDGNQIFSITTVKLGETSILNAFEMDTAKSANQGLTAETTSQLAANKTKSRIYMLVTVTGGPRE
jgi:type IVB pilus formation R64 PilN family outer membrane protein